MYRKEISIPIAALHNMGARPGYQKEEGENH